MRALLPLILVSLPLACRSPTSEAPPQSTPEMTPEVTPGPPTSDPDARRFAIEVVIDDWHAAAAEADEERYLGHFTTDAVFLGTDASERWTLDEFTEYVREHFPRGGWAYTPHDRHVSLGADGKLAWFDEQLSNDGYGELRGTGVLRRQDGDWRIAHYSMTLTVPNGVASRVVQLIRDWKTDD